MYVTKKIVDGWERSYGVPVGLRTAYEITSADLAMVRASRKHGRSHDVTFCIRSGDLIAVIAKPSFPAGCYRIPSGGLVPDERLEDGLKREAMEETGLRVEVERYLVRVEATFTCGGDAEPWTSHVFLATTSDRELAPRDRVEIREARWATLDELRGPIRAALVASGRPLLGGYRVELTDAVLDQLAGGNSPKETPRP